MNLNISTISFDSMSISIDDLKLYLKIDQDDENSLLINIIRTCEDYIVRTIGFAVSKKTVSLDILTNKNLLDCELNIFPVSSILDQKINENSCNSAILMNQKIIINLPKFQSLSIIASIGSNSISDELKMKIITHAAILYEKRMDISDNDIRMISSLYSCYRNIKI